MKTQHIDPVAALLKGRCHYRRPVPEIWGEPTLEETMATLRARCEAPMETIEGQAGQVIGYRCPRCGVVASPDGRTEHGPREIVSTFMGVETVLREPDAPAEDNRE